MPTGLAYGRRNRNANGNGRMTTMTRVGRAYRGTGVFGVLAVSLLLAGCAEMRRLAGEAQTARALMASGPQATQGAMDLSGEPLSMIDVSMQPDPETFAAEARVTWDGERTLQGIWVAHPLAKQARRVRIVNRETGAAIDGALFRRDGGMPGPAVLVSSDAAVALGLMPGTAVDLGITAIRRAPADPVAVAQAEAGEASEPVPGSAPDADAAAADEADAGAVKADADAAAAAPAGAGPAPDRAAPRTPAEPAAEVEQTAATTFVGPDDRTPPPPARNRFQPAPVSGADAAAGSEAAAPERPTPDVAEPEASPEPEPAASSPSEQRITPDMAAGGAASQPDPGRDADTMAETETEVETDAAAEAEIGIETDTEAEAMLAALSPDPEPASALDRPFIQAGIFAVSENARRLVRRIREAGYPAEGKPMTFNGREALRVVAGPFATAAERGAALDAIRNLGPSDAVPVRR